MTRRALIWCGYVDRYTTWDFPGSVADIRLSVRAALARGVAPSDIWLFLGEQDLVPEEFLGNCVTAETTELRRVALEIAGVSNDEDCLLFVGANHGELNVGLVAQVTVPLDPFADDPDIEHLSPALLRECLDGIRGTQVLIVGACAAGVFLPLGDDARRSVYAACGPAEVTHVRGDEPPRDVFLETMLGRWAGIGHGADLPPERVPLRTAFGVACQHRRDRVTPLTRGNAFWPD